MSKKFETEFKTPWAYMKAQEAVNPVLERCEMLEPFAPSGAITYFDNRKREKGIEEEKKTGYDRLYDTTPYDQKKPRCDRLQQASIWSGIADENTRQKVAKITSHWYGRPNRVQLDFPETKFYRSNKIQDNFYRRKDLNMSWEGDEAEPCVVPC